MFSPETIIDIDQLKDKAWGDPEVVLDLVGAFEEELPAIRVSLNRACCNFDFAGIQAAAHKLKGTLLVLAARCASLAELLERACFARRSHSNEIAAMASDLLLHASRVAPALRLLIAIGEL